MPLTTDSPELRVASIDAGNSAIKAIIEGRRYRIPNRIVRLQQKRKLLVMESEPLKGLHARISSPRLQDGALTLGIGALASQYADAVELDALGQKGESDQILAVLLTALALDAAMQQTPTDGRVVVHYHVIAGLPISEMFRDNGEAFKNRLIGVHEVEFLQTPRVAGIRVEIHIDRVDIAIEGYAAVTNLYLNENGRVRNPLFEAGYTMIADIGGQSTDIAVFAPGPDALNEVSEGLRLGISPTLDKIMVRVSHEHNYRFNSRDDLIRALTAPDAQHRNHISVRGNRTSIQAIVDEHLAALAAQEYEAISRVWEKQTGIDACYLVGGGAALLRPYIESINQSRREFPLHFLPPESSLWHLAESYLTLLRVVPDDSH